MHNPFSLEGKKIFITGASSGIGRAVATECSKMGASLVITGRNSIRLNETFEKLEGDGHKQISGDLQSAGDLSSIIEELPSLDGIVHAAGIARPVPVTFLTEEIINEVMGINFNAPLILTQQLLKKKKINRNSSIVFISSISGTICSSVGGAIYSASKGAVNGLIKGMALDLAPKSVRVNSVTPGMVSTDIYSEGVITDEQLQEDMKRYPLKRYGKPEEIAYSVIYLLSDASLWVTGSNLLIDGGYTLL
jgi:NAD(P)-dependent dehydrogenase (short-subunit alcohol dehydrogenase family)